MVKKRAKIRKTKDNPTPPKAKPVDDHTAERDDRDYGGMNLSNFKRNLGCGG